MVSGLRKGELVALLWSDLDIENRTIFVSKQYVRNPNVLEGYCGEGVPEAMQGNMLQVGIFQNLLVELGYGVTSSVTGWRSNQLNY